MYVHPDLAKAHHDDLMRTAAPSSLTRAAAATLLALAAPAVSFLPAFTTGIHGTGATIAFPQQYAVMLAVTVVATVVACALGALIAGRAGLVAIPAGLSLWMVTGFGLAVAGISLGQHAHLTELGIAIMAAVLAGPRGAGQGAARCLADRRRHNQ
jgi:uncharacterized phage protein gp47/JayE